MTASRTIYLHGLEVDLAEADGELLGYRVDDADELREHLCGDDADALPDAKLGEYAVARMHREIADAVDWPLWSEADCNGVSNRDFYYSTGDAR